MTMIPWRQKSHEPLTGEATPMTEFGRELDRLFESFVHDPWQRAIGSLGAAFPVVDIAESEQAVTVRAEIPGMNPDDVDVTVTGEMITISGEKPEASEDRSENHYCHTESRSGSFRRAIQLPVAIDPDQVTADYQHGVLTVRMQKREPSKSTKIKVDVS